MLSAVTRFSGRKNADMASCRAEITCMEREGRKSHVRRRERPKEVFVLSRMPAHFPVYKSHMEILRDESAHQITKVPL